MRFRAALVVVLVLVVGSGVALGLSRCERSAPSISAAQPLSLGREPKTLVLDVADAGSGLRSVTAELVLPTGATPLVARSWPGSLLRGGETRPSQERLEIPVDPKGLGLKDGSATLKVTARDWSWSDFFAGNETVVELPVLVDLKPPRIAIENGQTYLQRAGAGIAVYSISEDVVRDGVDVAGHFYPGFPYPGSEPAQRRRLAFFAIPRDAAPQPSIRVVAEDPAGNVSAQGWQTILKERSFPDVDLNLPASFFANKVTELAAARNIDASDPVRAFQEINSAGRQADEARVREIVADTVPERLWEGAFEQLRNSKVTSQFAERRHYFTEGKKISEATHYGFDLATTAHSPITAANSGRVIYADDLGIYGSCVVIDHGYGVTSLYGHLSRIDVAVGDRVTKGQTIGLSGATGLAGGDHLHFAILVRDTYVDPVEWWDAKWIREKIDALLPPRAGAPGAAPAPAASAPPAARGRAPAKR
ncbi:MAG TPA: M23 family metallopeptidase [Myxococcota bacterium]|nr:M23 family metallopeptidase [Myxococcota bacterium]